MGSLNIGLRLKAGCGTWVRKIPGPVSNQPLIVMHTVSAPHHQCYIARYENKTIDLASNRLQRAGTAHCQHYSVHSAVAFSKRKDSSTTAQHRQPHQTYNTHHSTLTTLPTTHHEAHHAPPPPAPRPRRNPQALRRSPLLPLQIHLLRHAPLPADRNRRSNNRMRVRVLRRRDVLLRLQHAAAAHHSRRRGPVLWDRAVQARRVHVLGRHFSLSRDCWRGHAGVWWHRVL